MTNASNKKVIIVVGPTASGKTALAVRLAKYFNSEVISADSRQFYRHMVIGTAQPTYEEMAGIPHHFINYIPVEDEFTAGRFASEAQRLIYKIHQTNDVVIVAGGSGLYLNALFFGIDDIPSDKAIRNELNHKFEQEGIELLTQQLKSLDPETIAEIDIKNPKRVIRALEVCLTTGKKYSELRKNTLQIPPYKTIWIGIDLPREVLYERINERVDRMIENGLVEEARNLHPLKKLNALQTVGYRELFACFEGEHSLQEAIDKIKQHTRNFAKRQMTWFRKNPEINWLSSADINEVLNIIKS
ncbi:MAG: tRNA (adenosine(37)-N6)-dimethylallyltransferase MiaA [Flavobacteriales bacterium]